MSKVSKRTIRKAFRKRRSSIVVVIERDVPPGETLFPEKVKRAKEILSKIEIEDPRFEKPKLYK
jgi:hypothetical protein